MNNNMNLDKFGSFLIAATVILMVVALVLCALVVAGVITSDCESYVTVGKMRVCND